MMMTVIASAAKQSRASLNKDEKPGLLRCARNDGESGYTLIEILIVLFIISIVSTAALLTIGRSDQKKMETLANEISQVVSLAEEQAMLQPTVLGMSFSERAIQFKQLQPATDQTKKNKWIAMHDTILNKQVIPAGIEINVKVGSESIALSKDAKKNPQVVISTNGDVTPFAIYIGKTGEKPSYAVIGDADGKVISQSLS